MERAEIETLLKAAFLQCEGDLCPLSEQQKEILLQAFLNTEVFSAGNPLDDLPLEEREILLQFIGDRERENLSWKGTILNDWLNDRPSEKVQFIRDRYGLSWLNRVQPIHWQEYLQQVSLTREKLQIGDAIEVSNGLWEWVREDIPDSREWYPCQVICVTDDQGEEPASCVARFETGEEYEIPGIYQWNRVNWRFRSPG
jgi:hypothetical protein